MDLYTAHGVDLAMLWPHIGHFVKRVERHSRGEYTADSLRISIERGETQLWVIVDTSREGPERFRAIWGTQIGYLMSGIKVCNIIFCAGNKYKEWLHLVDKLESWARSEGCTKLRGFMRRGWARDLTQFKIVANVMELEL